MLSAQTLTTILNAALQKLWVKERDLFVNSSQEERPVHERAIVAYLFHYLQIQNRSKRKKWDVEYNRQNGTESKKVFDDRFVPRRVVPDLILHERNTNKNYCAIEVKYSTNTNNKDEFQKDYNSLIDILRTHNYQYAISLIISPTDAYLTWFISKDFEAPLTIYINTKQIQSSTPIKCSSNECTIYHSENLPQCAKNALNTLLLERNTP